jgi:putative Ca2+/H+ antiporter (TMEM165/GDT1 family)
MAVGAAVLASTVLLTPTAALALDGTVTALASQTNTWFSGFAETGFYQAFSLVFVSEIGDKTFFIAGLLAMKTSRVLSFVGSMAALAAMTVISVLIGQIFHAVPSGFGEGIPLDDIAAAFAFAFFGVKTLLEAVQMDENSSVMDEELADAQEAVNSSSTIKEVTLLGQVASIFALVFAAEFGDRSFLSTIALSAAQNPISVCGGAIAAHAFATGIAVSGGSFVAKYVSEKVIGLIGGSLFIVFALTTVFGIF